MLQGLSKAHSQPDLPRSAQASYDRVCGDTVIGRGQVELPQTWYCLKGGRSGCCVLWRIAESQVEGLYHYYPSLEGLAAQASITGAHPCRTWLLSLQSHHDVFAGQVEAGWIRHCFYCGRCKQVWNELPDSSIMAFVPCVGLLRPRKCLEPLAIACDMFLSPRTKTRKAPHHRLHFSCTLSVPFTLRPALVAGLACILVEVKAEARRS